MRFLNRCNGFSTQSLAEAEEVAVGKVLAEARELFIAWVYNINTTHEYHLGWRFNSDQCVFDRIAKATSVQELSENHLAWALDALRDCASADYYYEFEKEY